MTQTGLHYRIINYNPKYDPVIIFSPKRKKCIKKHLSQMKGIEFVVIFERDNKENSTILLFNDQYNKYGIEIPKNAINSVNILSDCI